MNDRKSALTKNDFDVMIATAQRELATRRAIDEMESGQGGRPHRRRKAAKEIKDYEAHIVDLERRRKSHV